MYFCLPIILDFMDHHSKTSKTGAKFGSKSVPTDSRCTMARKVGYYVHHEMGRLICGPTCKADEVTRSLMMNADERFAYKANMHRGLFFWRARELLLNI